MEPNLLAIKFTSGFDQMKSILSLAHVGILKVLIMQTQIKFNHEYFFFLDYKLDAESGFRL